MYSPYHPNHSTINIRTLVIYYNLILIYLGTMPPLKSTSHKKKRSLASDIKIENAAAAKKARLSKPSRDSCTVNDSIVAMPTPTRQKQNDRFYKITGARLNLSFRSYHPITEVYTNMIPYISKEINGN